MNRLTILLRICFFSFARFTRVRLNSPPLLSPTSARALVEAPNKRCFDRFHIALAGEIGSLPSSMAQSAKGSPFIGSDPLSFQPSSPHSALWSTCPSLPQAYDTRSRPQRRVSRYKATVVGLIEEWGRG